MGWERFALVRYLLLLVGGVGSAYGLLLLVMTVSPKGLFGLAVWLLMALVLHDVLLAGILFLGGQIVRRGGVKIPNIYLAYSQVVVLVGGLLTLLVVPEMRQAAKQHANPVGSNMTVVPLDYGHNLFLFWVALTLLLAALILVTARVRARRA